MSWLSKNITDPITEKLKETVKDELKKNLIKTVGDCIVQTLDSTVLVKETETDGFAAKITVHIDVKRK